MAEASEAAKPPEIPERWNIHVPDGARNVIVDETRGYLSYVSSGRVENFLDDNGNVIAHRWLDGPKSVFAYTLGEGGRINFERHRMSDGRFFIILREGMRAKIDNPSEFTDYVRENFTHVCESQMSFNRIGELIYVNKGNTLKPGKEKRKLLRTPNISFRFPSREPLPGFSDFSQLKKNYVFDPDGKWAFNFPHPKEEDFEISRGSEGKVVARSMDGKKSFAYVWDIKNDVFVLRETHLQSGTTKILQVPLLVDLEQVDKALLFSRPPYQGNELSDVPWTQIDRIVGVGMGYSHPNPASPQESED